MVENSIVRQFKERLAVQASTVFQLTCLLGQPYLRHSIRLGPLKIFFCKFGLRLLLAFVKLILISWQASFGISPDPALGEILLPE